MAAHGEWRSYLERIKHALFMILWTGILLMFVISCSHGMENGDVEGYNPTEPPELQFCTFFNNRAPGVQPDLENCTWFRENSCCRQIEIDVTFRKMKSLPGSSKQCQRYVNYLMCYICSPHQYRFYMQQRLTVCEEFCNTMLHHCGSALWKGSQIGEIYKNGRDFCLSRSLYVDALSGGRCFYFNESMDTTLNNGGSSHHAIPFSGRLLILIPSIFISLFTNLLRR